MANVSLRCPHTPTLFYAFGIKITLFFQSHLGYCVHIVCTIDVVCIPFLNIYKFARPRSFSSTSHRTHKCVMRYCAIQITIKKMTCNCACAVRVRAHSIQLNDCVCGLVFKCAAKCSHHAICIYIILHPTQ